MTAADPRPRPAARFRRRERPLAAIWPQRLETWRGDVLALAFVTVTALVTRGPAYGFAGIDYDEQLYALIGAGMLDGQWPYADMWDRKPVGLFALFAFARGVGGPGPLPYQLLATAFVIAGGWLFYRLARRMADPLSAALAAAIYPVGMALYGSMSGQSEGFFATPMLGMALLCIRAFEADTSAAARRAAIAAMALGGWALQIKYTVAPQCAWFGLVALAAIARHDRRPARLLADAALFAVIGLAPTAIVAATYAAAGHWDAFVFANFESIFLRERYGRLRPALLGWLPPVTGVAGAGLVHAAFVSRARLVPMWFVAAGWLAAGTASLFMGSVIYPYYLAILVPPAVLVAMPFFDRRHGLGLLPVLLVLGGGLWIFSPATRFAARNRQQAQLERLVQTLRPHTRDLRHGLFVYDGPTILYALAGPRPTSPLVYADHFNNRFEQAALPVDPAAETARVMAARPGAVVTSNGLITPRNRASEAALNRALAAGYRRAAVLPFQGRPLEVWVRR